jgi:hypothetical protein
MTVVRAPLYFPPGSRGRQQAVAQNGRTLGEREPSQSSPRGNAIGDRRCTSVQPPPHPCLAVCVFSLEVTVPALRPFGSPPVSPFLYASFRTSVHPLESTPPFASLGLDCAWSLFKLCTSNPVSTQIVVRLSGCTAPQVPVWRAGRAESENPRNTQPAPIYGNALLGMSLHLRTTGNDLVGLSHEHSSRAMDVPLGRGFK